jgi:FixJ family two-component response regulator
MPRSKVIAVVDDDESVRESLPDLLGSFGFETLAFASAEEFLNSGLMDQVDCLILDVTMPGMTGPELQQELMRRKQRIPIVFITAHLDKRAWPALLKSGAVACLVKPFSEKAIVDAVGAALKAE